MQIDSNLSNPLEHIDCDNDESQDSKSNRDLVDLDKIENLNII